MKTTKRIHLVKALRYVFLGLTFLGSIFLLINLLAYFGITNDGPFIRGWITTVAESTPITLPHPDGSADLKLYNLGEQKLVMLKFEGLAGLFQFRYLSYILFQNLTLALGLFILFQMFRIFRNLDIGTTFQHENTRRIKWIALAVLMVPIARVAAARLLSGISYEVEGHQIVTARTPLFSEAMLLGGLISLVIFALAEVFSRGTQLQQELDLTI